MTDLTVTVPAIVYGGLTVQQRADLVDALEGTGPIWGWMDDHPSGLTDDDPSTLSDFGVEVAKYARMHRDMRAREFAEVIEAARRKAAPK